MFDIDWIAQIGSAVAIRSARGARSSIQWICCFKRVGLNPSFAGVFKTSCILNTRAGWRRIDTIYTFNLAVAVRVFRTHYRFRFLSFECSASLLSKHATPTNRPNFNWNTNGRFISIPLALYWIWIIFGKILFWRLDGCAMAPKFRCKLRIPVEMIPYELLLNC